ncbi:hypothetical protein PACI27_2518, partial [Pseudomonas aeruginosa CI27]
MSSRVQCERRSYVSGAALRAAFPCAGVLPRTLPAY